MISFLGGSYERGILERRNPVGFLSLVPTQAQTAAAITAGEITIAIRAQPGFQVGASILAAVFGPESLLSTDGTYQPVTLPVTSAGIRKITFTRHTQGIIDAVVGSGVIGSALEGWADTAGGIPIGVTSPIRTSYHSVSGRLLGVTVEPASEAFTLALRGITGASMRTAGRELIEALTQGEVRFTTNTTDGGIAEFTAWLDGDITRPQLRTGDYYEWDIPLRRAS